VSTQTPCSRCGLNPRVPKQRWCAACRAQAKREARARAAALAHPHPENNPENVPPTVGNGEQPSGWALGLADRVIEVTQARDAQPLKRRRPGRQLPDDWRARFLEHHAEHGVRWRGARYAGVSYDALVAAEGADPDFARQVEDARQTYLDRHALNLNRLAFKKDNVVASIVALKAGRPSEYIERAISVTANFTAALDPAAGAQLLQSLLRPGESLQPLHPLAPPPPDGGIIEIPVRPDPAG
jgi:hypothetical protein